MAYEKIDYIIITDSSDDEDDNMPLSMMVEKRRRKTARKAAEESYFPRVMSKAELLLEKVATSAREMFAAVADCDSDSDDEADAVAAIEKEEAALQAAYLDDAEVEADTRVYEEEMFDSEDDEAVASALDTGYCRRNSGLEASTMACHEWDSEVEDFIASDDDLDDTWYN